MELALVLLRLVEFAAAMLLLGMPAFAFALGRCAPAASLHRAFDDFLRRSLLGAAAVAFLAAALWLDLEAAIMANGWDAAFDPDTLAAVLGTAFGRAWIWHLGFGAALLVLYLPPLAPDLRTALGALLGAGFVASLAWAGHAVMRPGLSGVLVQAVHLLAGGLWLGSLPALFRLLGMAPTRERADALRRILPLYSRAGYGAVALVLLTGILNSAFLVGSPGALVGTAFGRMLIVKVGLVLLMVAIAARNRFLLQPQAVSGRSYALWRSVAVEQAVAVLILAAVSLLGTLPPALTP